MKAKEVLASDCVCCACGKNKATAFWPCVDPDIEANPYCQGCLEKAQNELLIRLVGIDAGTKLRGRVGKGKKGV